MWSRRLLVSSLGLLAMVIMGGECTANWIRVRQPDFLERRVDGYVVYRAERPSGPFRRFATLQLLRVKADNNFEYRWTPREGRAWTNGGTLEPLPGGRAELSMIMLRDPGEPGWFRVTAFNAAGESRPSNPRRF